MIFQRETYPKAGRFGRYGGAFVPEILTPALDQLEQAFLGAMDDENFLLEFQQLLESYAGRPTPLTLCRNLKPKGTGKLYLKREDLLHGGAHKTNQVIGQVLLAKRMGKGRIIAETGAGQHGVATAMVCALMGLQAVIYMGASDVARQHANVKRMELFGATVVPVADGNGTLREAVNAALRDWAGSFETTHYLLGTAAGPHPFPIMVRTFQSMIGEEARAQLSMHVGRLPDAVIAAVGGGSNAIGAFAAFLDDPSVALIGVEAGGKGLASGRHGAVLNAGADGVLHGAFSMLLQAGDGQVKASHSISAGLDYPAVGPEHTHLQDIGRATYVPVTDDQALAAFQRLAREEGILPALESSHALAHAFDYMDAHPDAVIIVNVSGRGDKDMDHVLKCLGEGV